MRSKIKRTSAVAVALLAFAVGAQALTISWDNGGDGVSWDDPLNWNTDTVPGSADIARNLNINGDVIVDTSEAALDLVASLGAGRVAGFKVVTGGTLAIARDLKLGTGANQSGQLVVDGGTVTIAGKSYIGQANTSQTGTVNLVSGSLTASSQIVVGSQGVGFFNATGGSMTATNAAITIGNGTGIGEFNLDGASVLARNIDITDANDSVNLISGTLQLEGGYDAALSVAGDLNFDAATLIWKGDRLSAVDTIWNSGFVTLGANGTMLSETYDQSWTDGVNSLYADYDAGTGYTTVWTAAAIPEPATLGLVGVAGAGLLLLRRRFKI